MTRITTSLCAVAPKKQSCESDGKKIKLNKHCKGLLTSSKKNTTLCTVTLPQYIRKNKFDHMHSVYRTRGYWTNKWLYHILQTLWLTSSYILLIKHNRFPHDNNKEITVLRCNTWSSSIFFNWAYFYRTWANFVLIICSCCPRYVMLVFKPRHILFYMGKLFIHSQILIRSIKYSNKYYFDRSSVHKLQSTQANVLETCANHTGL